jgi:excisionase family DNA binding protein
MPAEVSAPEYIRPVELARRLGVELTTVYEWIRDRRGPPAYRISRRCVRFRWAEVEAFIAERRVGGAA